MNRFLIVNCNKKIIKAVESFRTNLFTNVCYTFITEDGRLEKTEKHMKKVTEKYWTILVL